MVDGAGRVGVPRRVLEERLDENTPAGGHRGEAREHALQRRLPRRRQHLPRQLVARLVEQRPGLEGHVGERAALEALRSGVEAVGCGLAMRWDGARWHLCYADQ